MSPLSPSTVRPSALHALAMAALLLSPTLSSAAGSATATIGGTGSICGVDANFLPTTCVAGYTLTGQIALQEIGAPDTVEPTEAYGEQWIRLAVQLQWTGPTSGSMRLSTLDPNALVLRSFASVFNNYLSLTDFPAGADQLRLEASGGNLTPANGGTQATGGAVIITRTSADTSWLSNLGFNLQASVAPETATPATNTLDFQYASALVDGQGQPIAYETEPVIGQFTLTSWTVSAVPEPGTWALFGAGGLALLPLLRRRRANLG